MGVTERSVSDGVGAQLVKALQPSHCLSAPLRYSAGFQMSRVIGRTTAATSTTTTTTTRTKTTTTAPSAKGQDRAVDDVGRPSTNEDTLGDGASVQLGKWRRSPLNRVFILSA
eukprot:GHVU01104896.1.p6 GENE.GHVU01104896.1~~GHVU01104896.1.p6  ORF type:complete len:113 (-),score=8.50 GHVU01104896.1:48-386(-)